MSYIAYEFFCALMDGNLIVAPLIAFGLSSALSWLLARNKIFKVLDYPNIRSLHTSPIPRTGGVAILTSILGSWLILTPSIPLSLWGGLVVLALISLIDDIRPLPAFLRLAVHSVAAWVCVASLLYLPHGVFLTLTVSLALIWMINLFNFMDGSDGLAAGMALIGFGAYGMGALRMADEIFAAVNFCIAGSAAAFLLFNFHPARIFMGDTGSIPLGFLAGSLGIYGWSSGIWSPWFPMLVFSPFIADASVTLAKRLYKGKRIWHAHRDHYYQRLVLLGKWGHRNTALFAYGLMLVASSMALSTISQKWMVQEILVAIGYGAYLIAMLVFDYYQSANSQHK
ncbi:MAG: glycosyltransferase family 4 protein [Nitrosomonas sp.]|nr:glycosyltransferase family 4 protein [Nitrosomonas sp.]